MDVMRRIALIPLLHLALSAAGCGAASECDDEIDTETTQQEAAPIAASQVVQQFRESAEGRRYALWRFAVKRAGRWVVAQ